MQARDIEAFKDHAVEETSDFVHEVRMLDFESCGQSFTQVALVLNPAKPMTVNGREVVIVCSEGGSDNGRGFVQDYSGKEGVGPWLARRGIRFISLCRLGRWNFLSNDPLGSWHDVPLENRMPMFNRQQRTHWPASDFTEVDASNVASQTRSRACRIPRPGTALEAGSIALTPMTSMKGFDLALRQCVDLDQRERPLLLFWGFSTGGTYMWAFTRCVRPDGFLGYGTSNFPSLYYEAWSAERDHEWLYDRSAFRVRERGISDFSFYTEALSEEQRTVLWAEAIKAPQFKSHEDTFMTFNVGATCEALTRLWRAPFCPDEVHRMGYGAFIQRNLDFLFPPASLGDLPVLDIYGTGDEVMPPPIANRIARNMEACSKNYRHLFLDGFHHSIERDHVEAFGPIWLHAISSGYFE